MIIGYTRVSTSDQCADAQAEALSDAGASRIYSDTISGSKRQRPGLDEMLEYAREGDTVIVWKLDRLARSLPDLINILEAIHQRGAAFRSITDGVETSTAAGRLLAGMLGAIAEFERSLIVERTKAGLAIAAKQGRRGGRPRVLSRSKIEILRREIDEGRHTFITAARMLGISESSARRYYRQTTANQTTAK